jgi:uncharacterized membrane protein YebE (DUF533 family)
MGNIGNIIQGLTKSGALSGFAGGLAGSAVVGALSGKQGKKVAKSALTVGALAAVGGLAYTAYQRYSQGAHAGLAPGTPEQADRWANIDQNRFEAVVTAQAADSDSGAGLLLLRAMIAAAAADGHMDSAEKERIFSEAQRLDLRAEDKAMLFDELRQPVSMRQLIAQVQNPETAAEVYAASLLAIDRSRPEGQTYLRILADALELPDGLVASLHEQVNEARAERAA